MSKTKNQQTTQTTSDSAYSTGATYSDSTSGSIYITTGGTTTRTAGWEPTDYRIGGQQSFDFSPKFIKPEDPIEEAELKLAGICPECKNEDGVHEWGCSEFEWTTISSTISSTTSSTSSYTIGGTSSWATPSGISVNTGQGGITIDTTMAGTPSASGVWTCDMFGMDSQVTLQVDDGKQPNWFHRTMQKMLVGNDWKKND